MLATPSSFKSVGIIGGNIGMILIGIIAMYTMRLQILATKKVSSPVKSYSELGLALLGQRGKQFIDFCIMTSQTGLAIAYLIFIGQQLNQVICFETQYKVCNLKGMYIYLAAFILIPICWLRTFKYLAYISMASNVFLLFGRK